MITLKRQKIWMALIGVASLIIAVLTIIPYKSMSKNPNILTIELILKLIVTPIAVLGLSVYPNLLKYRQIKKAKEQSKIVSVLSYFPIVLYVIAIITNSLYLFTKGVEPLGIVSWNMWFIVLLTSLILIIFIFGMFYRFEMQLDTKEHIILDCCIFVITVCFIIINLQANKAYHLVLFLNAGKGDVYLLLIYILSIIGLVFAIRYLVYLLKDDDYSAVISIAKLNEFSSRKDELSKVAENDQMEKPVQDEPIQEMSVKDTVDSTPLEEESVEQVAKERPKIIKQKEVVTIQHITEKRFIPVADEELQELNKQTIELENDKKLLEEKEQELANKKEEVTKKEEEFNLAVAQQESEQLAYQQAEQEEKERIEKARLEKEQRLANREPKKIQPSYNKVVNYAKRIPGVSAVENDKRTIARFYIGRKPFLIINNNPNDYRLSFYADMDKIIDWVTECPDIRSRSAKQDNWFKLVNKGAASEELLHDIITSSHDALIRDDEMKRGKRNSTPTTSDNE